MNSNKSVHPPPKAAQNVSSKNENFHTSTSASSKTRSRSLTPKKADTAKKNLLHGAEYKSGFGRIPVEIKAKIFKKLTFEQRKILRLVCPGWLAIINETLAFRASLKNPKGSWIPNCRNFRYLFVQNWEQEVPRCHGVPRDLHLCEIEHLVIGTRNSDQNLILLLCTPVTKSLTLRNWAMSQLQMNSLIKYSPDLKIDMITKLSIAIGCPAGDMQRLDEYRHNLEILLFLLKSVNFQVLSTLSVDISWARTNPANFRIPALDVLSACFLGKYKKPIKELNLTLMGDLGKKVSTPTAPILVVIKSCFSDLRLQKFGLVFDKFNAGFAVLILMTIPQHVSLKLQEKKLWPQKWSSATPAPSNCLINTKTTFKRIGSTLQELDLSLGSFSFSFLEHFPCLESLNLRVQNLTNNDFYDVRTRDPNLVLPTMKKFSIVTHRHQRFEFWAEVRAFPERLVFRIIQLFPNLEEIELILLGGYDISPRTVEEMLRIKNIWRIKIGLSNFTNRFVNTIIMRYRHENGITVQAWGVGNVADITEDKKSTRQYHYVEFGIDILKIAQYYRPQAALRQTGTAAINLIT